MFYVAVHMENNIFTINVKLLFVLNAVGRCMQVFLLWNLIASAHFSSLPPTQSRSHEVSEGQLTES